MKTEMLLFFQLVTQCNAKYVECFSAQKECNKEKNRNSSVVPCKILKISLISSMCWYLFKLGFILSVKRQLLPKGKRYVELRQCARVALVPASHPSI